MPSVDTQFKKGDNLGNTNGFKKGQVAWNKGLKIDNKWLGKKHKDTSIIKMSLSHMNKPSPRKGIKLSEKIRTKMSENSKMKGKFGVLHHNYIKDRSLLKKSGDAEKDRRSSAYINWRLEVYKRDGYKCKIDNCDCFGRIIAHHILSYQDYPELRYEINNGITLCQAHHPLKRAEEKRLIPFFMGLVPVSNSQL